MIPRMTEYVTFVAPVDWREQLDGADPIRLFETWIVPPATGPIRQGGKVRRHLYIGPTEADEIAITVGTVPEAAAWAEFLERLHRV